MAQKPIEQSLILIKPDGVKRGLTGEIIKRLENSGVKLIGMKMQKPPLSHIKKHYPASEEHLRGMGEKTLGTYEKYGVDPVKELGTDEPLKIGKKVHQWNIDFLKSGPIVAIAVEGVHAIEVVRKLVGSTLPFSAPPGTIRGDYSSDSPVLANTHKRALRNIIHASSEPAEARREIKHWFRASELYRYDRSDEATMYY